MAELPLINYHNTPASHGSVRRVELACLAERFDTVTLEDLMCRVNPRSVMATGRRYQAYCGPAGLA